jgi:hypothetical protein
LNSRIPAAPNFPEWGLYGFDKRPRARNKHKMQKPYGQPMSDNLATAAHVATALIAFAALFRPDIERLFRRGAVDLHPAGRLEVGFSTFGPTIGLQGTLQAIHRDAFVTYSRVMVERITDNLRHEFQWAIFRPQSLGANLQQAEIASGFLLSVAAPRRFNIQFHDTGTADTFRQSLIDLQKLWIDYLQTNAIVIANVPSGQMRGIYDTFHNVKNAEIAPLFQVIDRQFYWVSGAYRMTLELRTTRPMKTITSNYTFALSETESNTLRLNAIACLLATCNVPDTIFNFAYPVYSRS